MDWRRNLTEQAREYTARLARAALAFAKADYPIVPGIGSTIPEGTRLNLDERAQKIAQSNAALFGRVGARLGPTPNWVSTHPLRNLTPIRVSAIHNEVLTAGWMLGKSSLDEDVILADSHLRSVDNSFRVAVIGSPFTIEPIDTSELACNVAAYQQKVLESACGWQRACKRLLFGNLSGYAIEEVVYANKEISLEIGGRSFSVEAPTPDGFEWVRNAHTRWNIAEGDRLEIDTRDGFVPISAFPHKFIRYEAAHDFQVRRRGYNYTNIWLSLIKLNAWARWGALLDIWGLRAPFVRTSRELWHNETLREQLIGLIENWSLGKGSVFPDDVEVEASAGVSDGDARGMHAALVGVINAEQSKLVQGEQLTTETGGAGSYALSETHADTKSDWVTEGEQNLSGNVRDWLQYQLRMACQTYNGDGTWGEPLPRGLCAALKVPPSEILSKCGRPQWRVTREMTPTVRMDLYDKAVNKLGMRLSSDPLHREFGFVKATEGHEALIGERDVLGPQDSAVGGAPAPVSVTNPSKKEAEQ